MVIFRETILFIFFLVAVLFESVVNDVRYVPMNINQAAAIFFQILVTRIVVN